MTVPAVVLEVAESQEAAPAMVEAVVEASVRESAPAMPEVIVEATPEPAIVELAAEPAAGGQIDARARARSVSQQPLGRR